MCVSPLSIPNPNYGKTGFWYQFKDTTSQMIAIPCGYCADCIALKQMYLVQRCQMESLENQFFFGTLTYSNDFLPSVKTSSGYDIKFADIMDIQLMFKRINNSGLVPGLRQVVVSEFGSSKGRPHFHILLAVPRSSCLDYNSCLNMEHLLYNLVFENWSRNIGSKRKPKYVPLCDYHEKWISHKKYSNYDLHYVNPSLSANGVSDVAWYVLKYMMKSSPREVRLQRALRLNLPDDEYENIWSMVRPRCLKSLAFGLAPDVYGRTWYPAWSVTDYIKQCIARSPRDYGFPWYYSPDSGTHFPLAPYYKSKGYLFSASDALDFFYNKLNPDELPALRSGSENIKIIDDYEKKISLADSHGHDSFFRDL